MGLREKISIGLEIGEESLHAVELHSRGKEIILNKYASRAISPSLITPSLHSLNITDHDALAKEIKGLFAENEMSGTTISLAIPDGSVKTAFLEFEDIPKEREKVVELIRWNMRKTLPFSGEEARVDFQVLDTPSHENRMYKLVAVLMQASVLDQYEDLVKACGLFAKTILPTSFAMYNLFHDHLMEVSSSALVTIVHRRIDVLAMKETRPIFYRGKKIDGERDGLREIFASLNYYHDMFDDMPKTVYVHDIGFESETLRTEMEGHFRGVEIKPVGLGDVLKAADASANVFSGAAGAALSRD